MNFEYWKEYVFRKSMFLESVCVRSHETIESAYYYRIIGGG